MRHLKFMTALLSIITRLFGASEPAPRYITAEVYDGLRAQILALKPDQMGVTKDEPVVAVLMETGYPEAVATLVSVVDGAASLYFSNGGGIIGGGENPRPNAASKKLVRTAASFLKQMTKSEKTPLPKEGYTRFYLITPSGVYSAEEKEDDLGEGRSVLSPLFHTAHELISELRVIDEQRRN